jgi:phenylacetate-CoA ligase
MAAPGPVPRRQPYNPGEGLAKAERVNGIERRRACMFALPWFVAVNPIAGIRVSASPPQRPNQRTERPWADIAFPRLLSPAVAVVRDLVRQIDHHARLDPPSRDRLLAAQMSVIVSHARRHSPFWRARLDAAGAQAGRFRLAALPPLTRADLRAEAAAMRARGPAMPDRLISLGRTSGSTGVPVTVEKFAPLSRAIYGAVTQLEREWLSLDFEGTTAVIRDAPDGERAGGGPASPGGTPRGRVAIRNMIDHSPEDLLRWLRGVQPSTLITVPSMAGRLARLAMADGGGPAIPHIFTFAEAVTPSLRAACRTAFQARIVDRYSCEEMGWIALQCPKHDHLHVLSSLVHLEIVDAAGRPCPPGQPGRVLLTGLHSYAMPLLRYDIGDIAEWGEPCDCGITLPVLKRVLGRRRNFLRLPDGTERLARLAGDHWQEMPEVEEFRLVQYGDGIVEAFLRCSAPLGEAGRDKAVALLRRVLGFPLPIIVTETPAIDWGRSYKREEFVRLDLPRAEALAAAAQSRGG